MIGVFSNIMQTKDNKKVQKIHIFKFFAVYTLVYTVVWLIFAGIIYLSFKKADLSFLWKVDGPYQHYASFNYLCDTLAALFNKGDVNLSSLGPLNFTIGQGSDILTTLNSYDFTDPVSAVCILIVPLTRLQRYTLMIFIKLWMVGAAFSVFCFSRGNKSRFAILSGALAYTYSGALLFIFARHPNYSNWGFFLPLLLAGVELYRRKGIKYLLILSVFFNILTNYYTFFINAVLLVVYVVVISICSIISEKDKGAVFKKELITDLKLALLCVLGALLSAVVLLPTLYAFTQNLRVGILTGYSDSMLHYEKGYIGKLLVSMFIPDTTAGHYSYLSMIPLTLVAVITAFSQRKKFTDTKILVILLFIFMCVPMAGRILNGFGYAINRFSYSVPLICSVILAETIPIMRTLKKGSRKCVVLICSAYAMLCILCVDYFADSAKIYTVAMILWSVLVFWFITDIDRKVYTVIMAVLVFANVLFNVTFSFYQMSDTRTYDFIPMEKVPKLYEDSMAAMTGVSTEDNFFRTESKEPSTNVNGIHKVNSTNCFWSLQPKHVFQYLNGFELNSIVQNCNFKGVDSRTDLMELASVKYFTTRKSDDSLIPYGYTYSEEYSTSQFSVYENKYALPIAYAFDSYITREDFEGYSSLEKQQVLMQTAVLEDSSSAITKNEDISTDVRKIDYQITDSQNAQITENSLSSELNDSSITLSADVPANCEIYVRIGGIEVTNPDYAIINVSRDNKESGYHVNKNSAITNIKNNWPVIRSGVTYNLGIGGEGENEFKIKFKTKSEFTYETLEILAVPFGEKYEEQAKKLQSNSLQNSYVSGNKITGDITLDKESLLQFSVPYSTGFKAYIDGKETDVLQSDVMYTSIIVPKGSHKIELKYSTPYLKIGLIVTCLTVFGLIIYEVIIRIVRKKHRNANHVKT